MACLRVTELSVAGIQSFGREAKSLFYILIKVAVMYQNCTDALTLTG